MKKILFVTNFFGDGGAARVMSIISNYFSNEDDYSITFVSFIRHDNEYEFPIKSEHIYLEKNSKFGKVLELRKIIKKGKYDVIISFEYFINMYTIIADMFLKNKLIVSERNDPKRIGNDKRVIRNFLYGFCDYLVCQTREAKNYFPKKIQNKSVIILNPIMDNLPQRYNGKRKNEIVTFCRIAKQKNLPLLIDAFIEVHKKYSDYVLKIYGDGPEKDNIKKYINDNKMNDYIKLLPFSKNIHQEVLKSKMFVSSSDYEGISNSMIEAMAIGLPTICTNCPCGGAKMMINDHKNGILIPVGDCDALAKSISEIISNDNLADTLSIEGTKIKEKLNKTKIIEEWLKIIE